MGGCHTNGKPRSIRRGFAAIAAVCALLISCDISSLLPAPAPTDVPGAVNTIVVQTAQAAASETAAAMPPTLTPTLTQIPTQTPSITPSPTPTFLFLLLTPTKTPLPTSSAGPLACQLTAKTPVDNTTLKKNQKFTMSWTVGNVGSAEWDPAHVDLIYVSGARMNAPKVADLPNSVPPGQSITLTLSMIAPSTAGAYKSVWALQQGKSNNFCKLNINLIVQ